jgi:hypothetical protein
MAPPAPRRRLRLGLDAEQLRQREPERPDAAHLQEPAPRQPVMILVSHGHSLPLAILR